MIQPTFARANFPADNRIPTGLLVLPRPAAFRQVFAVASQGRF